MRPRTALLSLLLLLVVLTACGPAGSSTSLEPTELRGARASLELTPSASAEASPDPSVDVASAVADLDYLLELLETIHPEPFHSVPRDEWVGRLREIQRSLPDLTPEESMVAVMELVAMLSRQGRDGHQIAFPPDGGPMLPIRVFEFADGLFITDAIDPTLVGARITAVAGRPTSEVLELLEPLVPRDSPATVPGLRPFFLLRADVLEGLGLIDGDTSVLLGLEIDGAEREVEAQTIPLADFNEWAGPFGIIHLPERDGLRFTAEEPLFWMEDLGGGALYVRLTRVQSVPTSQLDELSTRIADPAVTRVVFDLRHNPGGNNTTYPRLLEIVRDVQQPLWVLTDRRTFSAASNLSTEIEQSTDARFAGEGMGGGLNFWDDIQFVDFPNLPIPLSIGISTLYWQKSFADDPRLTIEPDLAVPYRSADYFSGTDAGLQAVLSAP